MVESTAAAAILPFCTSYCSAKFAMPTGTANLEFGAPIVQITGMQSETIDEYKGIQVTGRILSDTAKQQAARKYRKDYARMLAKLRA